MPILPTIGNEIPTVVGGNENVVPAAQTVPDAQLSKCNGILGFIPRTDNARTPEEAPQGGPCLAAKVEAETAPAMAMAEKMLNNLSCICP